MRVILTANSSWYLQNFRLDLARKLREAGAEVILLAPKDRYSDSLESEGFTLRNITMQRTGLDPLHELSTFRQILLEYCRLRPDVVHQFTIKCVIYGSLAARILRLRRVINAVTGMGYLFTEGNHVPSPVRVFVSTLYRIALKRTTLVFQNPDDLELMTAAGLAAASQSVLIPGSGVDTRVFVPQPEPDATPLVVLPARMLRAKGVYEFFEAARRLRAEGVPARFALVGNTDPGNPDGVAESALRQWQDLGVLEWWGWRERMQDVYAQSHLVCLPTYREGLPRSLLEAASCARAIVSTDVPGSRQVVRDGVNGILVPPRDWRALSKALRRLIEDEPLRRRMGQAGRRIVEAEYSLNTITSQTLDLYTREGSVR